MRVGSTKKTRTRTAVLPEVLAEWTSLGYVTIDAASDLLGVAKSTLYNTIASKRFPEGKLPVPWKADEPTPKRVLRLTYVKTPATLWVLRAAVELVLKEKRVKAEARAAAQKVRLRARRPDPAALAAGAAR